MEKIKMFIENEVGYPLKAQGDDSHAWYFEGNDPAIGLVEIKVTKEDLSVWYREQGNEDWYYTFDFELAKN